MWMLKRFATAGDPHTLFQSSVAKISQVKQFLYVLLCPDEKLFYCLNGTILQTSYSVSMRLQVTRFTL